MSSISHTSSGLFSFLQSAASNASGQTQQTASTLSPSTASTSSSASSSTLASALSSGTAAKSGHHHHGSAKAFEKLASAVTSALQDAQASGSTQDPNKTITSALEKIFANNSLGDAQQTDADNDADTNAASANGSASTTGTSQTADAAKQEFLKTLSSFGVSAQQFQSDLNSALQNGGSASSAFASFPPGILVDTVG